MKNTIEAMGRISAIDTARGIALVAMTIYHFTWDLEFFGWAEAGTTMQTGWVLFARGIASSFIFLVGVSLVLAHNEGIRWPTFRKRLVQIVLAAAAISAVTLVAVPGGFIFFGILHGIALFSLLGLLFTRLHWLASAVAAIAILAVENTFSAELFSQPYLWWVGLAPTDPPSNDYVPLFPWFAAALFGVSFAKLALQMGWFAKLAGRDAPKLLSKPLGFIGRHSLVYYLIHQPAMMALIWCFTAVAGPPDATPAFISMCQNQCVTSNDVQYCTSYCGCVAEGFKSENVFQPFVEGKITIANNEAAANIINLCSANRE